MQPTQSNMLLPDRFRNLAAHHHIRYCETAARPEYAKGFPEHAGFICGEVDDAVRNDHIDRVVRQRDVLYLALQKLNIVRSRLPLILSRKSKHVIRHIETVGFAGRPYSLRR